MARVKDRGRPKTSRPEREPSQNKTVAHDRDGKADRTIPGRRARIVVGKEKDRKMIKRPHQSADLSDSGKADHFRQLRNQKSAPTDFFAERTRKFADHSERGRDEHEKNERERRRKILPTEICSHFRQDRHDETAETSGPGNQTNRHRGSDRNQITGAHVSSGAPAPLKTCTNSPT